MDRLTVLPTRPLAMSADLMEFAFGDGEYLYLVAYQPTPGAPADLTKLQFDRTAAVLDLAGAQLADFGRMTGHVLYNDPTPAIGTPADFDPAAAIMAEVDATCTSMAAWARQTLTAKPLFEQLAPAAAPTT